MLPISKYFCSTFYINILYIINRIPKHIPNIIFPICWRYERRTCYRPLRSNHASHCILWAVSLPKAVAADQGDLITTPLVEGQGKSSAFYVTVKREIRWTLSMNRFLIQFCVCCYFPPSKTRLARLTIFMGWNIRAIFFFTNKQNCVCRISRRSPITVLTIPTHPPLPLICFVFLKTLPTNFQNFKNAIFSLSGRWCHLLFEILNPPILNKFH